jgi:hypothetical protein
VASSNSGDARKARTSPAARANRPSPTEKVGVTGTIRAAACLAERRQLHRLLRFRKPFGDAGVDARDHRRLGAAGVGDEPLAAHHQISSTLCPPIITAARSLPATETTRLSGSAAFIHSPSVGTFRCLSETVYLLELLPGTLSSSAQ